MLTAIIRSENVFRMKKLWLAYDAWVESLPVWGKCLLVGSALFVLYVTIKICL